MKTLPGKFLWLVLAAGFAISTVAAEPKKKAPTSQANSDDMWVAKPLPATFPSNVTHHTYNSAAMKRPVGYCIYLPPGYANDTARRYPVIYNLHGAGGNETRTVYSAEVLHAGILAGRWPEIIMVFPNGGRSTMYQDSADGRFPAETTFIKELIPHIDTTCRTIAERKGRCIEGFSMGGRGSTHLALKHPDLFCSLFNQAGNVYHASEMGTVRPDEWPVNYLGADKQRLLDNDSFANLTKNLDRIKGRLRIQIACGTQDDGHLPTVRDFHAALLKAGVDHTYIEIEGLAHNQRQMIDLYRPVWFDYHVESLRRTGVELHHIQH
jgi:S-formylglutathione hydrolase FrmB